MCVHPPASHWLPGFSLTSPGWESACSGHPIPAFLSTIMDSSCFHPPLNGASRHYDPAACPQTSPGKPLAAGGALLSPGNAPACPFITSGPGETQSLARLSLQACPLFPPRPLDTESQARHPAAAELGRKRKMDGSGELLPRDGWKNLPFLYPHVSEEQSRVWLGP